MSTQITQDEVVSELETMKSEIAEIEDFLASDSKDETVNANKIARLKELNAKYSDLAKQIDAENASFTNELENDEEPTKATTDKAQVDTDTSNTTDSMGASVGTNTSDLDQINSQVSVGDKQAA